MLLLKKVQDPFTIKILYFMAICHMLLKTLHCIVQLLLMLFGVCLCVQPNYFNVQNPVV